jgi:epoxyqueuosine reductase
VDAALVKIIARECGFELAGVASADPPEDFARYANWVEDGNAGEMRYLTDRRCGVRSDLRNVLETARSVICVGKLYNQPGIVPQPGDAIISRYAWGPDYHDTMRESLRQLAARLAEIEPFESKVCVDTAPLLERTFARLAGLGWIGKNTCLINEPMGSWFFLGELITSLEIAPDAPPPDRCGTCTRCIDACPTEAFVPAGERWAIDARRCIAYFNIELRGSIPEEFRAAMGTRVFGCDVCQDVCPWNSRAPSVETEPAHHPPALEKCAYLSETEFEEAFSNSAVARPRYAGFLRNVAVAMGNTGLARFAAPLAFLARNPDPVVAEHARWALRRLV